MAQVPLRSTSEWVTVPVLLSAAAVESTEESLWIGINCGVQSEQFHEFLEFLEFLELMF